MLRVRAEYHSGPNQHFIHYLTADGRGTDVWLEEGGLSPATAHLPERFRSWGLKAITREFH